MTSISIRRGEFDVASEIMTEASRWLTSIGQPLWQVDEVAETVLRGRCAPDSVLVGYSHGEPVVTALLEWHDERFWPGVDDAGFIHRLAVRRLAAGQGHAAALLDWAAAEAARHEKASLNLDCLEDRPRLCAFYERCGFERAGLFVREPYYRNVLYRRPVQPPG